LAMLAGADRVEGCLFGNGERTGNVDLVTLALNLYSQGIAPGLDFSQLKQVVEVVEQCNQLPVHPRHPYAGELVFTAFSGSHQDAIKKGFAAQQQRQDGLWQVPYLPLDPADVGCSYEAVIRVNSQSGKSGAAWLLEQNHGLSLPRGLQIDFSKVVQRSTDGSGKEMTTAELWRLFRLSYGLVEQPRLQLLSYQTESHSVEAYSFSARVLFEGQQQRLLGVGNGLLSSAVDALRQSFGLNLAIEDYHEHTLGHQSHSRAVAYIRCTLAHGEAAYGVGIDVDSASASLQALFNVAARYLAK
ncbi:MAG: alpha-isopropylmalate synthase regulatory domain-containing protein, partial [Serratia proteamaculans]